uniref:RNase H type-1 domain-containing protein n=1 Tax=Cannabis sativa TaxID=3483 RepID=A0A803NS52_CANSA
MLMEEKGWDVEIIEDMFEERDAQLILSIQLSDSTTVNSWHWMMENSGFYTVKSAYNYLQASSGSWLHFDDESYLEKAFTKHVNVDLICPLCNVYYETIFHVLVGCRFAQACWHLSAAVVATDVDEFSNWFFSLMDSKQTENKNYTALRVVQSPRKSLDQWRVANKNKAASFATGVLSNSNIWRKPMGGKIKINVDGAIFEAQRMFGFGCVARDHAGQLLEAISDSKFGVVLPEIAEIVGMKEALSWIKEKGGRMCSSRRIR